MSQENRNAAADGDAVYTAMARAMAGEGAPEEREAFRRSLEAYPARAALYAALDASLRPLSTDAAADVDVEAALAAVLVRRDARPRLVVEPQEEAVRGEGPVRVDETPANAPRAVPPSIQRPARWRVPAWLPAAALVVALIGAALLFRRPMGPAASVTQKGWSTGVGARDTIFLADGSIVQLAPRSRLEVVTSDYGRRDRVVRLEGEAYFEVRHDAARPFVVRTAAAVLRDLGTTFTVRTGDSISAVGTRVAVTSGSVALEPSRGGAGQVLRAGDRGSVDRAGNVKVERGVAGEDDVAWTQGRLVFRDAPIPEVAQALRRWYGITLVVRDPELARRHLTASFGTETADEAVQVVAAALGGQLQRRGDTASVVPPGGGP